MDLNDYIRDVPDFPKPGIVFKDITPLLADTKALRHTIETMRAKIEPLGVHKIAGIESRGFLFGVPIARDLGVGAQRDMHVSQGERAGGILERVEHLYGAAVDGDRRQRICRSGHGA